MVVGGVERGGARAHPVHSESQRWVLDPWPQCPSQVPAAAGQTYCTRRTSRKQDPVRRHQPEFLAVLGRGEDIEANLVLEYAKATVDVMFEMPSGKKVEMAQREVHVMVHKIASKVQ